MKLNQRNVLLVITLAFLVMDQKQSIVYHAQLTLLDRINSKFNMPVPVWRAITISKIKLNVKNVIIPANAAREEIQSLTAQLAQMVTLEKIFLKRMVLAHAKMVTMKKKTN